MKRIGLVALFVSVALIIQSCYYDSEEILYPGSTNCNPIIAPSFTIDVLPLLNFRCNNCHSGVSPSAGIKLNSHAEVIKYVNNGSLLGSIKHNSGYSPMPKNGTKLTVCQIDLIQTWIGQGALNN